MGRLLHIAARVAAPEPAPAPAPEGEAAPIETDKSDELITMLKRQLDMINQAARRDNPQRAMKLLEGCYHALEALLKVITEGHEEVEERREMVEDKLEQAQKAIRPIRMQIH